MTEKPIIEVRRLTKEYPVGDEVVVALKDINLTVPKGQILCIFGQSGSGKSTLLNQLAGMEKPTRGGVRIGGQVVSAMDEDMLAKFRQTHLGFVFQAYNLLPNLTAAENVALPLMFKGVPKERRDRAARKLLTMVGLGARLDHFPKQMSGGQQQRVGIARAFITKPDVVFADEPTGNLDSKTTLEVMEMISGMARKFNQTIVLVSHDPEMTAFADRIVTLKDGEIISDEINGNAPKAAIIIPDAPGKTAAKSEKSTDMAADKSETAPKEPVKIRSTEEKKGEEKK